MCGTIIQHIRGKDIPPQWWEGIIPDPNQLFTIIISSEKKRDIAGTPAFSRMNRNRIFDLLKGDSGSELSKGRIRLIKSVRTDSPLKVHFDVLPSEFLKENRA